MHKMIPLPNSRDIRRIKRKFKDFEIVAKKDCHTDPISPEPIEDMTPEKSSVFKPGCVPEGMDVFWSSWQSFLPPNTDPEALTTAQKKTLKNRYRYSPLRPGSYQNITGIRNNDPNRGTMC